MLVAGVGGQGALLDVGPGGLTLERESFPKALPGGPSAIGGLLLQPQGRRTVAYAVLLQNAPGSAFAAGVQHPGLERAVKLPRGRYVLTLLGDLKHEVRLSVVSGRAPALIRARGPRRVITQQQHWSTSPISHTWSETIRVSDPAQLVAASSGYTTATGLVTSQRQCLTRVSDPSQTDCSAVPLGGPTSHVGTERSSSSTTTFTTAGQGDLRFEGRIITTGLETAEAWHSSVVITPPPPASGNVLTAS